MLYGVYKMKQIIDCSNLDFSVKEGSEREWVERIPLNLILEDYTEMFKMLSDIKNVIDKWVQEEDENKNIDKLMQEGEHNEL